MVFGLLACTFLLTSCDNELVVTAEWKDIPAVWGFLSKSDTAHYLRVEKAFLDPNQSALEIARIPDSLYYENATVSLKRITSGQVYQLTKVDGTAEGYPRDPGVFAELPNYLYKIKANAINLVVGEEYQFILDRGDGKPPVTAQTVILAKPSLRSPVATESLNFRKGNSFLLRWTPVADAGSYDIQMRFNYQERSPETGNVFQPKSIEWTIARNLLDDEHTFDGADFYSQVKARIPENMDADRLFSSVDILLWCGGEELAEFIRITQANTGITSTQDIPTFTNLSEGFGIFTSRNLLESLNHPLTSTSLDSLRNGSITGNLNFL